MIRRRKISWASLPDPKGSEPGYRRPVLVVQSDAFNRSRIHSVAVAAVTSNVRLADAPGNVRLTRRQSKLTRDSVIIVSQIVTLDKRFLTERVSRLSTMVWTEVESGLRLVLSL